MAVEHIIDAPFEVADGGFISGVDGRSVRSAPVPVDDSDSIMEGIPPFDASRFVIQGMALRYHRPLLHGTQTHMFLPDCATQSLAEGGQRFLLQHSEDVAFCSTDEGRLELVESDEGVALRVRLLNDELSRFLVCAVGGGLDGLSIGFKSHVNVRRDFASVKDVLFHGRIEIMEVSLVRRPAVETAFCVVAEAKGRPPLAEEMKLAGFANEGAAVGLRRALRRLNDLTQ